MSSQTGHLFTEQLNRKGDWTLKVGLAAFMPAGAGLPGCEAAALPSLFQRWRRMDAVVMAEMEMRLMVGVTSTWSTLRPRDSSGALSGSEFFMALPS